MTRIAKKIELNKIPMEVIRGTVQVIGDYLQLPWINSLDDLLASGATCDELFYLEQMTEALLAGGDFLLDRVSRLSVDLAEITGQIAQMETEDESFSRRMSALRRYIARKLSRAGYKIPQGLGAFDLVLDELWEILEARDASPEAPLKEETLNAWISPQEKKCAENVQKYFAEAIEQGEMPLGEMEDTILCMCRHHYSLQNFALASEFIVDNMEAGIEDPIILYDYFVLGSAVKEFDAAMQGFGAATESCPDLSPVPADLYQVEQVLGKDRTSTIFFGYDREQKPVLLKVLNNPPAEVRSAIHQARALNHGGIVSVYDFHEDNFSRPCVAMECPQGSNLREYVEQSGPFAIEQWLQIAQQVTGALAYAHDQNIVHGNLTPARLYRDDENVKIADFGMLSTANWPVPLQNEDLPEICFIAPELLLSNEWPLPANVDVYSLAKTLYYLLTGKLPHQMSPKDVPERVWPIFDRACDNDPANRYENATKMLEELAQADAPLTAPAPGATPETVLAATPKDRIVPVGKGETVLLPEKFFYRDGTVYSQIDNSQMVLIPKGSFLMGSNDRMTESPAHEVYMDNFLIDRYLVTNAQYARFLEYIQKSGDHSKCHKNEPPNKNHTPKGWETDDYKKYSEGENCPVIFVDWWDAWAYAAWVGKSLPSEAHWEKTARGEENNKYPWGAEISPEMANYGNSKSRTTPVGQYPKGASKHGCLDMAGNVWEWCQDSYSKSFYRDCSKENPVHLDDKAARALRGGSWNDGENSLRTSCRACWINNVRYAYIGFRCALQMSTAP